MGYTYAPDTSRRELVAELTSARFYQAGTKILAKSLRGSDLWVVVENPRGQRLLLYFEISGDRKGTGYKGPWSEQSGLDQTSCPIAYLELVPCPGEVAKTWRDRVYAMHARGRNADAFAKWLKIGSTFSLPPTWNVTNPLRVIGRQKRSLLFEDATGKTMRMTRKALIAAAELASAQQS